MSAQDGMWAAIGLASLAAGGGLLYALIKLGGLFDRTAETLQRVDAQLTRLSGPVNETLVRVGGIAANVEKVTERVDAVAGIAESAAAAIAKTADAAQAAVSPTMATIAGIVAGVSQGAKTFFGAHKRGN